MRSHFPRHHDAPKLGEGRFGTAGRQPLLGIDCRSSEDAIVSKSIDGIISTWNVAAERLFGYKSEEAVGRSIMLIVPPDRSDEEKQIITNIRAGRRVEHFETVRRCKNGQLVDVSLSISPIRDEAGNVVGAAKIVRDITARLKAEAELRKSEEQRRLALDAGELGAWNIDPTTNLLETDERFRLIFSGSKDAIDYEQAFGMIHPDDVGRVRDAVAAATQPNDPVPYAEEYRVVQPNGDIRWVLGKGRASFIVEDSIKRVVSFDGTVVDITDRKNLEEELRSAATEMSENDRRKDEFLAMLAHELRNPLAPIRNALHIVQMSAGDERAVREASEMIDRQVHHMVRLVDDLLDVSRITRGKIDLRLERVDLAAVIRQAVETSRPAIEAARHKLTRTLPLQTVWLNADPVRLAQVFSNLINNACKYSEPDGRVTVTSEVQQHDVVVSVKDTGIGIPTEMLPKIFELFSQLDQSLERSQVVSALGYRW